MWNERRDRRTLVYHNTSCLKDGRIKTNAKTRADVRGRFRRLFQAKKSHCEGRLRFFVGQKRSSSRHLSPTYFLHVSVMKMLISSLFKSTVSVFWKWFSWKVIHYGLYTLISFITKSSVNISRNTVPDCVPFPI
jgi:hypothetical protein